MSAVRGIRLRGATVPVMGGLLLSALVVLFYRDVYLGGRVLYSGERMLFWYPTHRYLGDMVRAGRFDFWNPHVDAGFPLIADGIAAPFYPLSYVFGLVNDAAAGSALFLLVHLLIGGAAMHAFARALGCGRLPSMAAPLVWLFGGLSTQYAVAGVNLALIAWFPVMLLSAEKLVASGGSRGVAFLALAIGAGLISVPVDVVSPALVVLVAYLAVRRSGMAGVPGRGRGAALALASVGIGVAISAISLIPQAEFARLSGRVATSYEFASTQSLHPLALVSAVMPRFFLPPDGPAWGHPEWALLVYSGVGALLLSLVAVWGRPRGAALFFACAALMSLLFAFGEYFPLHRWLYEHVPLMSLFRGPTKALPVLAFSVSVLSALGLDRLSGERKPLSPHVWRAFLVGATLCAAAASLVAMAGLVAWEQLQGITAEYWRQKAAWDPANSAARFFAMRPDSFARNVQTELLHAVLAAGVASFLIAIGLRKLAGTRLTQLGLLALMTGEALFFSSWSVQAGPAQIYDWYHASASARVLDAQEESGRFLNLDGMDGQRFTLYSKLDESKYRLAFDLMPQNAAMVHGLQDVREGPTPVLLAYEEYMRMASPDWEYRLDPESRLLALLNVRYIVTENALLGEQFQPLYEGGSIRVYRNQAALPRAFVAGRIEAVGSRPEAFSRMAATSFDPSTTAVVETRDGEAPIPKDAARGNVRILRYEPDEVDLASESAGPSLVVLADVQYPGWRVAVDGGAIEILRVDGLLRGVVVPAGPHLVEFRYEPDSLKAGAALTALGLGLSIVLLAAGSRSRTARNRAVE